MADLTVQYLADNHPTLHRDLAAWAASGVTTVEQLGDLLDNEAFSDMWKDRYGTRPRMDWTIEQKREWIANAPALANVEDDELEMDLARDEAPEAEPCEPDDEAVMDALVRQAEAHEDRRVAEYKRWRDRDV